jgi:uncharacterized membrane protein
MRKVKSAMSVHKKKIELTFAFTITGLIANAQVTQLINTYLTPLMVSAYLVAVLVSFLHNLSKISSQQDGDRKAGWVAIGLTATAAFIILLVIGLIVGQAKTAFTL